MTSLELADLTVWRGANPIVTGLGAEIRPGRIFWITGPNGAGKSSLLRVLAGVDRPRVGQVLRIDPAGEGFLYFHSEMALPGWSTVGDWRRLLRRLLPAGDPGPTGLWPHAGEGRRVGRLSTGERKRLLLDALLRRPGSLLLDEPYEHLSPEGKAELTRLLEERVRTRVVVVATNQATSRARRDGGLYLEGGVVEELRAASSEAGP